MSRDLDFRMVRGHSEPDQAKGDRQSLVNVHLNILTCLGGGKGENRHNL